MKGFEKGGGVEKILDILTLLVHNVFLSLFAYISTCIYCSFLHHFIFIQIFIFLYAIDCSFFLSV